MDAAAVSFAPSGSTPTSWGRLAMIRLIGSSTTTVITPSVQQALRQPSFRMIDCSHGNSLKDHTRQGLVAADVASQLSDGSSHILGVMIESNLVAGRQDYVPGAPLTFGQSITDACIDLADTESILENLAAAVKP